MKTKEEINEYMKNYMRKYNRIKSGKYHEEDYAENIAYVQELVDEYVKSKK